MEVHQTQPSGLRAASVFLTISIVALWLLIPGIVVLSGVLFLASFVFNDNGTIPQQVAPFIGGILLFVAGLVVLLAYSIRTRRELARMLPRARTAMLVFGAVYTLIALCILFFPFPDPLALIPGALGIWWLVYFSRSSTQAAFDIPRPSAESLPPTS